MTKMMQESLADQGSATGLDGQVLDLEDLGLAMALDGRLDFTEDLFWRAGRRTCRKCFI